MYDFLDTSTPNSGLGTPLRSGGEIINANFRKLHAWMESRSNIASANIPTVVAGGPRYLLATEFVPGDPMPLTCYERTTAPSDVTNPAWVQSADLQWWKAFPTGGEYYIQQFGGKADSDLDGVIGRDNFAAAQYAMAMVAWQINPQKQYGYTIKWGAGHFRFSDTLEIHRCVHHRGVGGGFEESSSTFWHFPANKTFVIIGGNNTTGMGEAGTNQGDGNGTTIENFTMRGKASSTNHALCGILLLSVGFLKHVGLQFVNGNGFWIVGRAGVHLSDFTTLEHCSVHSCSRHALRIDGNDANVCHISDFSTHGPTWTDGNPIDGGIGGCGVWDTASFGNKYDNIHIAGFGNQGVQHLGRRYRLIAGGGEVATPAPYPTYHPGEDTTPGTNDLIWYDEGALASPTTQFPAWTATPTVPYRPQIPFLTNGAGHIVDNLYVETNVPSHLPGATISSAGTFTPTKYSNTLQGAEGALQSTQGFRGLATYLPGQRGYTYNGPTAWAGVGTRASSADWEKGISVLDYGYFVDDSTFRSWNWYFDNRHMIMSRGRGPGQIELAYMSTPDSPSTFNYGRSSPPEMFHFNDLSLRNAADANQGSIVGLRERPPTSGYHARGELYFNMLPNEYGFAAVMYTTAGNPGVRAAIPLVGMTSVSPQDNGDFVIQNTSNTQVTFKYKGSDGVIRTASLTLS